MIIDTKKGGNLKQEGLILALRKNSQKMDNRHTYWAYS